MEGRVIQSGTKWASEHEKPYWCVVYARNRGFTWPAWLEGGENCAAQGGEAGGQAKVVQYERSPDAGRHVPRR
jgi:hypothetical protein